jgi:hypothetical protein
MSWQLEIPIITRVWINDLDSNPTYSDSRIQQVVVVAALNVNREVSFTETYDIDVVNETISPDPTLEASLDNDFVALVALKAACILDQSTYRTKAINEGIKTSLASASLHTAGNLKGYKDLLDVGPCAMYSELRQEFEIGNPNMVQAVLSPFVGNKFDASNLNSYYGGFYRNGGLDRFYS